jgi:hypothetical protein
MNVQALIEYMDSMMNVKEDTILNYENFLQTVLIACQFVLALTIKYFACMEVFLQIYPIWTK